MVQFLSCSELYKIIQQKSRNVTELLWVCSPSLGLNAHKIFSQEIIKNLVSDFRFVFQLDEASIKRGETNPLEVQFFMEHFKESSVKSYDNFHCNIYIFDNSAVLTSATLTEKVFEKNIEAGLIVEGPEVNEVKEFFDLNLWQNAKPITDLKNFKKTWNHMEKTFAKKNPSKKTKAHTKIQDWTDDYVNRWYFGLLNQLSSKAERIIRKETNWSSDLLLVGDVGYNAFRQLKLGDLTYLVNLYKKRGNIEIDLARVFDKSRVETDEGDLHFVCQVERKYLLDRQQFFELLKKANIHSKSSEIMLNADQLNIVLEALPLIKNKRKTKK